MYTRRRFIETLAVGSAALGLQSRGWAAAEPARIRSVRSGAWSAGTTWQGGAVPAAGAVVSIQPGHEIIYDVESTAPVRMVHVLGNLTFARDRNTRLDVGLLKIGGDPSEDGASCMMHAAAAGTRRPALIVGTQDEPLPAQHTALIRLVYLD